MTNWTRDRLLDALTEVGAYALEPEPTPTSIERTYGYYAGWRSCVMYLQRRVRMRDVASQETMAAVLVDTAAVADSMAHGLAFTHPACADPDALADSAVGDARLRVLVQYYTGWQDAVAKAEARLEQVAERVYE